MKAHRLPVGSLKSPRGTITVEQAITEIAAAPMCNIYEHRYKGLSSTGRPFDYVTVCFDLDDNYRELPHRLTVTKGSQQYKHLLAAAQSRGA